MSDGLRLNTDVGDADATEQGLRALLHKEGAAVSDLRPSGVAQIEGNRVDVVTRGEMIAQGDRVRVRQVEGNRVVVERVTPA
jgi:membrane-bound serine protease (ClpP class)